MTLGYKSDVVLNDNQERTTIIINENATANNISVNKGGSISYYKISGKSSLLRGTDFMHCCGTIYFVNPQAGDGGAGVDYFYLTDNSVYVYYQNNTIIKVVYSLITITKTTTP
jgi:hypothetical protein